MNSGRARRIGILCLSAIPDDPRVRRQGDLFHDAGWNVVTVGLPGHRSPLPAWQCLSVGEAQTVETREQHIKFRLRAAAAINALREAMNGRTALRPMAWLNFVSQIAILSVKDPAAAQWIGRAVAARFRRGRIGKHAERLLRAMSRANTAAYAERLYWSLNDKFEQIFQTARRERVDLWLANDWTTLPIARRLAKEHNVPFGYDTHELAVDEYTERWSWRLMQRPIIAAIEGGAMREAAFVSCVSDGIAARLHEFYGLPELPLVVRNTPSYEAVDFRPTGEHIRVLYHGLVSPGRGIEACIESAALWRAEFTLTIRGPSNPEFLTHLIQLSRQFGVADRVTFAPAVAMVDLVRAAADFDVGLFALPCHSLQNVYALPNKLFEYMMAGLALCVSDLPEMARILKARNLGVLIEAVTPQAIATAINGMNRMQVDAYKRNALIAAYDEFCWEHESRKLREAGENAAPRGSLPIPEEILVDR